MLSHVSSAFLIFHSSRIPSPIKHIKILNLCLCWNLRDYVMARRIGLFVYVPILKKKSVAPVEHMANRQVFRFQKPKFWLLNEFGLKQCMGFNYP